MGQVDHNYSAIPTTASMQQWNIGGVPFRLQKHYSIIKQIGQGAYGIVCEIVDRRSQRHYAVKKCANISQNLVVAKQTLREIKLVRLLIHQNIIKFEYVMTPGKIQVPKSVHKFN